MPTILTKKSDTPGAVPATADLTNAAGGAELAVNTADKRLFALNSSSAVVEIGTNPGSLTTAEASATVFRSGSATITNLLATSLTVSSGSTLNGGVVINELGADADTRIEGDTDANLFFVDASTDRIGIGTNNPGAKVNLEAADGVSEVRLSRASTNIWGSIQQRSTSGALGLAFNANDGNASTPGFVWRTATDGSTFTEQMVLNTTGLGVGTTSPSTRLTVSGANTAARGQLSVVGASAPPRITLYEDSTFYAAFAASGTDAYIGTESNTPFRFLTNGSERARITSGGFFKASNAGTYVNSTGSFHELRSDAADAYTVRITQSNATPLSACPALLSFTGAAPNDTTAWFLDCTDNAARRAYIRSNGGLSNYQSNNTDLSDIRTKKDITPAASMWDKIGALEIVTYKYNDQTHDDINVGVIAQQVETVEPVWVDNDGWDKETPEGEEPLKTVYTKDITFAAIKALQEAMTRIEELEAKVAALEAK